METAGSDFDLEKTLNSGQVFHWEKTSDGFVGTIGALPLLVKQRNDLLEVTHQAMLPKSQRLSLQEIVAHYFALDHPLSEICATFPDDPVMNAASGFCRGLRIIRQPKWECLATFICSSMKQVAHIRQISLALRRRFGDERKIGGHLVYTFPPVQRIAKASEDDLRKCALGYRAGNLRRTAGLVSSGMADLKAWSALSDADLREKLCALPGVGAKVANCVMLFAYERLRAFPIDVWIERVLKQAYFLRKKKIPKDRLREFSARYFGEHGGYAQQYLFHHARMTWRTTRASKDCATAMGLVRNDKERNAQAARPGRGGKAWSRSSRK